jgi:hypothetical protein
MYAFEVRVERHSQVSGLNWYTYTVATELAEKAIRKAQKQARSDSGYKGLWKCTELKRGRWIVS